MKTRTSKAPECNPQTQCKLFALPAEIRNAMYTMLFTLTPNEQGKVTLCKDVSRRSATVKANTATLATPTVLSILQTCRLILREAESIFYANNHLSLYDADDTSPTKMNRKAARFVSALPVVRLSAISGLMVVTACSEEAVTATLQSLRRLGGLKTLTIYVTPMPLHFVDNFKRERLFLTAAALNLPATLEELHFCVHVDLELMYLPRKEMVGQFVVQALDREVEILHEYLSRKRRNMMRLSVGFENWYGVPTKRHVMRGIEVSTFPFGRRWSLSGRPQR